MTSPEAALLGAEFDQAEIAAMRLAVDSGAVGVMPELHRAEVDLAIRHSRDPDRIMGSKVSAAPPDPIFGIKAAYDADPRPALAEVLKEKRIDEIVPGDAKLLLAAGVFLREGRVPLLPEMREIQGNRIDAAHPYLPITGDPTFCRLMPELVYGSDLAGLSRKEIATVQTAGGTHGLFTVGLFLKLNTECEHVFVSDPAWPNYETVFSKVLGMKFGTYPYYNSETHQTNLEQTLDCWRGLPANSAVVLQLCGHNPSGIDWTPEEWKAVSRFLANERPDLKVIVDAAYVGLAKGLQEDGFGGRALVAEGVSHFMVESDSKIFSGYGLRAAAVSLAAPGKSEQAVRDAWSQLSGVVVRGSISNAPDGAVAIGAILSTSALRMSWENISLAGMRDDMDTARGLISDRLAGHGFDHLARTAGMFGLLDLNQAPRQAVTSEGGIHLPGKQGRLNYGGFSCLEEIDYLCKVVLAEV